MEREKTSEGIATTKHGKSVVRPISASSGCAGIIGSMKGKIRVHDCTLSTRLNWDAPLAN
jgi:hypothetical protein